MRRPVGEVQDWAGLGHPLYVNGQLFQQPVTISHVPGVGEYFDAQHLHGADPSMGALGAYAAYRYLGAAEPLPGADPRALAPAAEEGFISPFFRVWRWVAPVSALACAYHGYRRNDSIGWALWWFLLGGLPITPVLALAQGFGDRKGYTSNLSKRQRAARKGARTRATGGTKIWTVISRKTNHTVDTVVAPAWKSADQVEDEARAVHGADVYVAHRRKANRKRRRR